MAFKPIDIFHFSTDLWKADVIYQECCIRTRMLIVDRIVFRLRNDEKRG